MAPRRDLHCPSLAILAAGLLSVGPVEILAQTSTAVCLSSFNWMNNIRNQSPCVVTAYLQGACNGGQFTIYGLSPNTHYTGPYVEEQNECQCSSVTYSTISACGLCQNRTIISWSTWNLNCTTVYPGVFPSRIPYGTAVPAWAFQDVTKSDLFDVTLAQTIGDNPESTATNSQSTGFVATSTTASASLTDSPSTPSTSSPFLSSSNLNIGAIAGGVVGGVVGVALIAGVVAFFVMKKKRSQIRPSAWFAGRLTSSTYLSPGSTDITPFAFEMAQPKLYDPSNSSTPTVFFPAVTKPYSKFRNPAIKHSAPSVCPRNYAGVPEI